MNRAVFLDRDGVINRKAPNGQYITSWQELELLPGAADAIAMLNGCEFRVIVVTNQRCIAKQLVTEDNIRALNKRLCEELAVAGSRIDAVYYCPHDIEPPCNCRKPSPGMLLQAARDHHLDLQSSWMVGDSESDIIAGRTAGCRTVRLLPYHGEDPTSADLAVDSLISAARKIIATEFNVRFRHRLQQPNNT